MSKEELIAKSISRFMFLEDKKTNGIYATAKNCLSFRKILQDQCIIPTKKRKNFITKLITIIGPI
jgi:hypothetical protein